MIRRALVVLAGVLAMGVSSAVLAQEVGPSGSPAGHEPDIRVALVERAEHVTYLDLGPTGLSVGDVIIWGPDSLYDAENAMDTGATTQGTCTSFTAESDCILTETIVFPTGTLELQGVQPGDSIESIRTIVAGSGSYLGATGTVRVQPAADLTTWTKTFEIWFQR